MIGRTLVAAYGVCLAVLWTLTSTWPLRADSAPDLARLEQYALTHSGNAERGRRLFGREKVTRCLVCHRVGAQGGRVGPDLSMIGGKFDRPHLIESLLQPSRQIVEGYRPTIIVLTDGRTLTGIVKERSAQKITLLDADNQPVSIRVSQIEERVESDVSLMPEGLAKDLTADQFTDLIAYLETLRPGGKPKPGAGIAGPIVVPNGFGVRVVATGLDGATALEALPDGRMFVCEQTGAVRVIEGGRMRDTPLIRLPVDSRWERGLIGVTIDPGFPQQPFVYLCRVIAEPSPHHIVSRLRVEGNRADPRSEQVLLEGDDQTKMGGKVPSGHQGGALHFGPDGCLYIAIGEQTAETPAQHLNTLLGKILRIRPDGSIPHDNPFLEQTTGKYRAIWALGCRNPFTFAIRSSDGLMLINDVGGRFEEINLGQPGANYGWPSVDHGPTGNSRFRGPIYWYPQASIAGGDFAPPRDSADVTERWPTEYSDRYFFADFVHGWIRTLDPDDAGTPRAADEFASGLRRPVDLRFDRRGNLYVLLRNAWVIDGKFQGGTGSLLRISPQPN